MPEEPEDDSEKFDFPPSFFPSDIDPDDAPQIEMGEPVEVAVEGVFAAKSDTRIQHFVLLSDGRRKLPIVIGQFEAGSINLPLEGSTPDRPVTHDLLKVVIERLGGEVEKIVIDDLFNTTFYAKIFLRVNDSEETIDSRPSDAIALALRCNVPIFVAEGILDHANNS